MELLRQKNFELEEQVNKLRADAHNIGDASSDAARVQVLQQRLDEAERMLRHGQVLCTRSALFILETVFTRKFLLCAASGICGARQIT